MTRLLIVAPQPFYQDRGTPIALRHVLTAASELGWQVDMLTLPGGRDLPLPGVRYFRVPNPLHLRTVPIGFSVRKLWFDAVLFVALVRRLRRERYDAIHAVEEAAFLAVLAAGSHRIPVIYDMQSSLAEQMSQQWWLRSAPAQWLLHACERWLLRRVAGVMASAGLASYARTVWPETRISEWRFPSQVPAAAPGAAAALRRELGLSPEQPVVVYTGSFEEYQGLPMVIEALPAVRRQVPEAVFVFVGADGPRAGAIERRLAGLLPRDAYRLLVRQPQELLPAFLDMADVALAPRLAGSNLPIKVLDYLAAGCAIVAADIPAQRSILTDELACFAAPTAEGFAGALTRVLTDADYRTRLRAAARAYAAAHVSWTRFAHDLSERYAAWATPASLPAAAGPVSVIIPARNAGPMIARIVAEVRRQAADVGAALEVLVVDDGSTDRTAALAAASGARVVRAPGRDGNPAAARNLGAREATGDVLVFLDADCTPGVGWLRALLTAHASGEVCVGGALDLPPALSASARWDYYCGWYHVHSRRPAGAVPNHPPCNLSIRRDLFLGTVGFTEQQPIAYSHEELAWQAQLPHAGARIFFEPRAVAYHWNRPGVGNLLRRNYRWAYSAIESKAASGDAARMSWLYRAPWLLVAFSLPLAVAQAVYVTASWVAVGVWEPLRVFPMILAAKLAYGAGMLVGGVRRLTRPATAPVPQPRWV